MSRLLVTTSTSGNPEAARALAAQFGCLFEPRGARTLRELLPAAAGAPVLVLGRESAWLHARGRSYRASVGLAHLRVVRAARGEEDPLVRAAGLRPGDRVLDCTLGLAGDALVAAHAVGPEGSVLGIEASPVLAAFAQAALVRLRPPCAEAARRIAVRCADHRAALREMPSSSADVVLFDPMFSTPAEAGPLFELVRAEAEAARLEEPVLREALRVARRGVLIKDAAPGAELARLGIAPLPSRRSARIVFGWVDAGR